MNKFYAVTIAAAASVMILTGCKSTDSASQNNNNAPAETSAQPQAALSLADVEALAHAHVSDDVIISQIQNTHSVYHLAATDIIHLRDAGVSDRVVNYMINTAGASAPAAVQASALPPAVPSDTATPSPGNGYAWVAGEWQWNGATWVWSGGHWVHPPWVGAVWVPGYWYRGPFGGWRHVRGHWR